MAQTEVLMPKMGESVIEATIIKWSKNEGDRVKADETLLEIATDKVDSEIPAPSDGILVKKLCKEGDVIPVGKAIAIISTEAATAETPVNKPVVESKKQEPVSAPIATKVDQKVAASEVSEPLTRFSNSGRFYSPLVRSIAQKEGITVTELETIPGSGKSGRVTKNDMLSYLPARQANGNIEISKTPVIQEAVIKEAPTKPMSVGANDEIIEMDRMRKLIADHMVMSKRVSPHVTSYVEADVTNLVLWREKIKKEFEKKEGEKLTFTPIFIEATVKALKDYPMVNVSIDGTRIIRHKDIHIGMAVALPTGNLIVPVIRYADRNSLLGITKQVNNLASRARINKLMPDDTQGGTFTITNVGTFGNIMGTPIINQPQAAILATGIIKKKPVVIESPLGDMIAIRHMMYLSLSYDHRVVDGALGGSFLKKISDYLESFDINRTTW